MTNLDRELRVKGERLRARQEKAKAELEAERAEQERVREERARAFWNEVDGQPARLLRWPRRQHGN